MSTSLNRAVGVAACAAAVVLLALALLMSDHAAAAPRPAGKQAVQASDARIRLAAVPGRPAAGYLTLRGGAAADALTGVTSPLASRIEMHSESMTGGVMRMAALPAVAVGAGATANFSPGGNHLMIFGLPATLKPGTPIPLTLNFQSGAIVNVMAVAAAPAADMAMPAAGHAHGAH